MTFKQIEAARETRLWITQIIIPMLMLGTTVIMVDPELRESAKTKVKEVKAKIKGNLRK